MRHIRNLNRYRVIAAEEARAAREHVETKKAAETEAQAKEAAARMNEVA